MKRRYWLPLLVGIPALLALVFAACGGDDDDDGGNGGDSSSGGSVATGSDEKYVADICKAASQFFEDLQKITQDAASSGSVDESELMKKFQKPFENFASNLEKAKPPKDLQDWHAQAVKQIKSYSEAIKKGDTEALENSEDVFPEPPQAVTDRLEKVAASNKDCQEADVTFGS